MVVSINQITKYYGANPACLDISLEIGEGQIYGFLGLNGAGKTTLIRILLGMIKLDAGEVALFGHTLDKKFKLWNQIGYLVESASAYPNLSVYNNLTHYALLRGLTKSGEVEEIIDKIGLRRFANIRAKNLSLGNKQRLGLAKALIHKPKLLILDEPINGLDPAGIVEVREMLKEMARKGTTIFLSSHNLEEIWRLVDRVGIIHNGQIIEESPKKDIKNKLLQRQNISTDNIQPSIDILTKHFHPICGEDGSIQLIENEAVQNPEKIIELLVQTGLTPKQVVLQKERLEDLFMRIINSNSEHKTIL